MPVPPTIFVSYSHRDKRWLDELRMQLAPLARDAVLDAWDDTRIAPGSKWEEEIRAALDAADVGVLLVTPHFLASDFIARHELPALLAGTTVFWIAISHCHYEVTDLAPYQAANDPKRPLDSLAPSECNQEWKAICQRLLKAAADPPALPRPPVPRRPTGQWNVPYPRNPFFTGREEILQGLRCDLTARRATALTQAIRGLGGIGKTQTAVEYAYRHRDDYRAVLWARADAETTLATEYRALAELLGIPERDAQDLTETREAVNRWLAGHEGYLLILDNADDPTIVKPFLPPNPGGHILLTSRAHHFDILAIGGATELPVLPDAEALAFLLRRTRREDVPAAERDAAATLAEELGGLPLALEQAAAYIVVHQSRFQHYLDAFRTRKLELLEKKGPEVGDSDKTVATTWAINLDAIGRESPAAADLLFLSAYLAPDRIPHELLVQGAPELGHTLATALKGAGDDPIRLDELLEPLARYSLIRRDIAARTYDIHRLVQAVIQAGGAVPRRRAWIRNLVAAVLRMEGAKRRRRVWKMRVVRAVDRAFPDPEFSNWPVCERLLPHALSCEKWIDSEGMVSHAAWRVLNCSGFYLVGRAQYAAAEPLLRRALAIREQALGPEYSDTATSLNNLADLYYYQGQYAAAEPLYRRALAIREQALGPEHPDTAESLDNLAVLYDRQGQSAAAGLLYRRALAIREKVLGSEHPGMATSLSNLAGLYSSQGQYAAAEPLLRRALAIREKVLGSEHPNTADSLNNLAVLYSRQGQYAAAEPLYRRALAIREKALGPEHPDTAYSLNSLAALSYSQGQYTSAEPLYRRALAIREKALGPEHPATALSLNALANLYSKQGRIAEAEPLLRRALAIREKVLGPEHPNTAASLHALAMYYDRQDEYAAAEPLYRRVLAIDEKALGPEHPYTANSLNNLAQLYRKQEQYAAAEPLLHRALAICEKALGSEHPHTAYCLHNLAMLNQCQGQYEVAEPLFRRALAIREEALGPEHSDTASSLFDLAVFYSCQDQFAAAEPLYRRALAIREKALGPEHPDTAKGCEGYASLLDKTGRAEAAAALRRRAESIRAAHARRNAAP